DGGTAQIWDLLTEEKPKRLEVPSEMIHSIDVSKDGRLALFGTDDAAQLWDLNLGKQINSFSSGAPLALSPDGRFVLMGDQSNSAQLLDTVTGKEAQRFEGHSWSISAAAFSADGSLLATASGDQTARLWNVRTGAEIRRFDW